MRLAVYCDYSYRVDGEALTAEMPFALFLQGLFPYCDRMVMVGRLDPAPGRFPYLLHGAEFAALPYYESGADLVDLLRSLPVTLTRFWIALHEIDVAWIMGPTPLALLFAAMTLVRRRRLVLGVRQDLPRLFRHRYPNRPLLRRSVLLLEGGFRVLSRIAPVVVVGPDLARRYRGASSLHTTYVSLLSSEDLLTADDDVRSYEGPQLRMLSVGRLDPEKNPLLLADILASALRDDSRWHLDVCGDGPLLDALRQRLEQLGIDGHATLHGHVPIDGGLLDLYRTCHVFLHVSLTEGVPQVLLEAFALRLPVIATAVGGVPELVGDCGLLIAPANAEAAADALARLLSNRDLRDRLVERASETIRSHTREAECAGLATFLMNARATSPVRPAVRA